MPKLDHVVARVQHEVALTSIFVDIVVASAKQDLGKARRVLRDRVKHTTLYRAYGWGRMMATF